MDVDNQQLQLLYGDDGSERQRHVVRGDRGAQLGSGDGEVGENVTVSTGTSDNNTPDEVGQAGAMQHQLFNLSAEMLLISNQLSAVGREAGPKAITVRYNLDETVCFTLIQFESTGVNEKGECDDKKKVLTAFRRILSDDNINLGKAEEYDIVLTVSARMVIDGIQQMVPRQVDANYAMSTPETLTATFRKVQQPLNR